MIEILAGNCLDLLALLPDHCIQCCVTSPPFYGLRNYGTTPQVWGGDAACEHRWVEHRYYVEQSAMKGSAEAFSVAGPANAQRLKEARWRQDDRCETCGAWRGELGLEPTVSAYVENLVAVFRQVRRVLRNDGTLWLNMGDSYARNPAKGQHKPGDSGKQAYVYDRGGGRASSPADLGTAGLKEKDLIGIPWRVAFALQADGWYLRSDIIWAKGNPMPESVKDRPTRAHEYVFLLTKSSQYYYDQDSIREPHTSLASPPGNKGKAIRGRINSEAGGWNDKPDATRAFHPLGRNKRSWWPINTRSYRGAHFATFPPDLVRPCLQAGTSEGGACAACGAPFSRTVDWHPSCTCSAGTRPCWVLDPFGGAGTVAVVAQELGRSALLLELNPDYVALAKRRVSKENACLPAPTAASDPEPDRAPTPRNES